jgi:hypothetical protein
MKKLLSLLVLLAPLACLADGPVFGGNMPALRPKHVAEDTTQFDLALSFLKPGDIARVSTLAWEVQWDPKVECDFTGIDAAIKKLADKGVTGLWLLQPTPHPTSLWYKTNWSNWFMPSREIWPDVVKMDTKIALHIIAETAKLTKDKPLLQLWNEPEGKKPGGSSTSKYGEWDPQLHELLYLLVKDLRAHDIPKSQIVGPAMSSFGEGKREETAEFLSMMPPSNFDWLSECGYRDCHIRLSASWAHGNLDQIRAGFQASLDWVTWVTSKLKWPADQQVLVSEFYVTPGDVGMPIGTDMYPFHAIAFDLLKASKFTHVMAWGLRPGESESTTDPWAHFGGMGDSLSKWRAANGG